MKVIDRFALRKAAEEAKKLPPAQFKYVGEEEELELAQIGLLKRGQEFTVPGALVAGLERHGKGQFVRLVETKAPVAEKAAPAPKKAAA